jgi:hypothetical protein
MLQNKVTDAQSGRAVAESEIFWVQSVNGALLYLQFAADRESFLLRYSIQDRGSSVFSYCRTVLESVAGTSPNEPDVLNFGMAVYEEISVGRVLVLAYAALDQWRIPDLR